MKKIIFITVLMTVVQFSHAQTRNEWLKQKKTQIEYYVKQIGLLMVYIGYIEKGYNIAKKGTNVIHSIRKGEFNLHDGYFNSLKAVNPSVKNYKKVNEIISNEQEIETNFQKLLSYAGSNDQLTADEKAYIRSVYDNVIADSEKEIDKLYIVVTSGESQMKDNERLEQVEHIYASVKDKLAFSRAFCGEVISLINDRINEQIDIDRMKLRFGRK